ncbi:MAG: hypothetical protein KDD11_21250, partial [Acidobacteria bacterium]|nr:hypothetical protein [Acidobacteriota bacterium]
VGYGYDRHGNLLSVTGGPSPVTLQVDAFTNRLLGHAYDPQGNLLEFGGSIFTYDPLGTVTTLRGTGVNNSYLYDAGGERVAVLDYLGDDGRVERWSLRGTGGELLRQVEKGSSGWRFTKDFVRGSAGLLASIEDRGGANETIRFFHNDHLGSPRLITNRAIPGEVVSYHEYLPFGWELTDPYQDNEPMQFTGHERDRNFVDPDPSVVDRNDDLDYMHARYYSPLLRRFLSVDSVQGSVGFPQSWNRFSYVSNNPLSKVDPDGLEELTFILMTFIPDRSVIGGYNGNDRGFDPNSDRFKSKMIMRIESDPSSPNRSFQGLSRGVGKTVWSPICGVRCTKTAPVDGLEASLNRGPEGRARIGLSIDSVNPLAPGAPAINVEASITVSVDGDALSGTVAMDGFPAVELYVQNEAGKILPIVQYDPRDDGNSPFDLFPIIGDRETSFRCYGVVAGGSCETTPPVTECDGSNPRPPCS